MNDKKRVIVNFFSQGRENYKKGSERLVQTIVSNYVNTDIMIFSPDFMIDSVQQLPGNITLYTYSGYPTTKKYGLCKPHKEEPYLFKSALIQFAREAGYESVLWCDSSIMLFKNPEHYFELAKEIGVVLFDNPGCPEATWTSDDCLNQLGCDPEYAKTFFEIDAACMLFNFSTDKANEFFDEYLQYCNDGICLNGKSGSTRPDFKAHRHDQSIASYLVKKHYINTINYGGWTYGNDAYSHKFNPTFVKLGIV
jgi:hypothetical protein